MSSFLSLFQTDTLLLFIVLIQGFYLEVKQSTQEAEISEIVLLRLQNCHIRPTQTAQVGSVSYFNDSQARAGTRKSCKQIWLKSSPKDYVVPTDYKRQTSRNLAKKIKKIHPKDMWSLGCGRCRAAWSHISIRLCPASPDVSHIFYLRAAVITDRPQSHFTS